MIDASDPERDEQIATVDEVLDDIGAGDLPRLRVYNKIDRTDEPAGVEHGPDGRPVQVRVSAMTGEGLDLLRTALVDAVGEGRIQVDVTLPAGLQRLRSRLFALGAIEDEKVNDDGSSRLTVDLARRDARELERLGGRDGSWVHEHLLKS